MKKLTTTLCLTLAVLLGSVGGSWSAGCEKGVPASMGSNPLTSMLEWQPLAEQGNANAQYKLGTMYDYGGLRNNKTAVKWYTLAAEQGNTDAQNNLGGMYKKGKGVPQNYKTAVKWYRLAAEQGNANAQYNLGSIYARGEGVIQDNVYAHMCSNIVASSGESKNASINKDIVAKRMTSADIYAAEKLARECIRKKYKGC